MSNIIIFEGDYVLKRGESQYSRVVDIIDADTVLLASGETCTADVHDVENYMSEREYWEYSTPPSYRPQNEY